MTGATLLSLFLVLPARAIEMFTYFGDGSRIGLPSLEVPVQAYPGIPLRSDRIRARSRAQQLRRAAASQPGVAPAGDGLPVGTNGRRAIGTRMPRNAIVLIRLDYWSPLELQGILTSSAAQTKTPKKSA